jgi:cation diffusion facilitator CzcD-associated flavoprotein CzcO
VRLRHEVESARWDDGERRWHVQAAGSELRARVLVVATGPLSEPHVPHLPGLDRFEGVAFHSADWDHDVDLTGRSVAAIGTGASAIQYVPRIQPLAERLLVFQRSAPWVVPRKDRAIRPRERELFRRLPHVQRLVRAGIWLRRETLLPPFVNPRVGPWYERGARKHMEDQVADPELRRKLTPDYAIGCKRVLISDDFYPALTQPNVELVTDRIAEIGESSVVTADGARHEVDTLIFGTGFRASEWPFAERVRGRGETRLSEAWHRGASAYLGTAVAGFPNMFLLYGPNTNLGHNSIVFMLEAQFAYLLDALTRMRADGLASVEVRADAQAAYNDELDERLRGSVWNSGGCQSWYLDESGRNSLMWPSTTLRFRARTRRFDPAAYVLEPTGGGDRAPVAAPAAA